MYLKKITLFVLISLSHVLASAQCGPGIPSVVGCNTNTGGVCHRNVDTAMVNHLYHDTVSFFMPHNLNDPSILSQCSCNSVELRHITITGVSGLPTGMSWTSNHANKFYDVQNGDSMGCLVFCGTPIAKGTYSVIVSLLADVTAYGTPIGTVTRDGNAQSYNTTLIVKADTIAGVTTFTYGNNGFTSCDSLTLPFNALRAAPNPNPTSYSWDFGNGNTSTLKNPGSQTYTTPGVYPVVLKTTFYKYRLHKVFVANTTTSCWQDVCDIACAGTPPDVYLTSGALAFNNNSSQKSQCSNILFDNLNLPISEGTTSIDLSIWDDDVHATLPICGADDPLGSYTLAINPNVFPLQVQFSSNCSNGYAEFDTITGTVLTDTLWVKILGRPATPMLTTSTDSACNGDSIKISISNVLHTGSYVWYKDSVLIPGATDTILKVSTSGKYTASVINTVTGCNSASMGVKKIAFGESPLQTFSLVFDDQAKIIFVSAFVSPQFAVKWFKDSIEIAGQSKSQIPYLGNGVYQAEVYNKDFPYCKSFSSPSTVYWSAIQETSPEDFAHIQLQPNPTHGKVQFSCNAAQAMNVAITLTDILGATVVQYQSENAVNSFTQELDMTNLQKGIYLVKILVNGKSVVKKVVLD